MKTNVLFLTVIAALLLGAQSGCSSNAVAPAVVTQPERANSADVGKSLYERLGGYDAIAAVTDDLLAKMIADRQLGRFFVGLSNNSKDVLRQHIVEFLCVEAGGPCRYVGRDLGEVHTGLGITPSDWASAMKYLDGTLEKYKVPSTEAKELVGAITKYREDIVGR